MKWPTQKQLAQWWIYLLFSCIGLFLLWVLAWTIIHTLGLGPGGIFIALLAITVWAIAQLD